MLESIEQLGIKGYGKQQRGPFMSAGGGTENFNAVIRNATTDSTIYDTNRVGASFQYGFTPSQGLANPVSLCCCSLEMWCMC